MYNIGINTTIPRSICIISFSFFSCVFCNISLLNRSIEEDDMQYLLKERNSTQTAIHMADEYLKYMICVFGLSTSQASSSHQALLSQRNTLSSSHNKMMAIINRVPGVNSLIKNIQNKSSKDKYRLFISFKM